MRTKKMLSILLALVMMLSTAIITANTFSAATTETGENLINNSSFENNQNWTYGSNMSRSTDKANSGSYSVKCTARGQAVTVTTTQTISVTQNTDYILSGYVYRSDNSAWAYIDMNDRTGEVQLLDTSTYGSWNYVSGIWNSGDSTSLQVRLVVEPNYTINQHLKEGITGDIWFDDVTLVPVIYDSYSEIPPSLSASAKSYTLENSDITVCVASDNNKEYLTSLTNKENGYNWINEATEIPLLSEYQDGDITWTLSDIDFDNTKQLSGTGKDACHVLTFSYNSDISGLILKSFWKIYPTGPIYHYSEIYNNTGSEIKFDSGQVTAGDIILKIPDEATVYSFNRSRYNNGWDGNFTTGVFNNEVTTDMFFKSTVENSWLVSSGSLPYELLQSEDHGLYVGYEWSYGNMLMRTQNNKNILRFTAELGDTSDVITRENGDTLLVPPVFYGAYSGNADDGSNNMKKWFYNHLMTASLRENTNEPLIEFHLPLYSESDLINYLNSNDLEEYGVELTKMDYWWTVSGSAFDDTLEQQWNPDSGKWPNGMTYGKLVKSYYPSLKTSLYMCDTYNGVDIGTKEGQQAQIEALTQRMNEWDIDYWRSDFDLLKPNNYANHEGLMNILDTMIANDSDFRYEHCSAGGSLKDFSTLQRMTFMTMEDSGGALNHRMAFYSNSYMINPIQLKFDLGFDWTSDEDASYISSYTEKWTTYNVRTAMMGAMMVQNVGSNLTEIQKQELIEGWDLYKTKQRKILRGGNVYHILPMPDGKNWDGMQFYNDDIEKGSVFLFRDKNIGATDGSSKNIKLQGLDENVNYILTFQDRTSQNTTMTGKQLMEDGITVTGMTSVYDSEIIWIEKAEEAEKILIGDVDQNGAITVSDVTEIQKYCAEMISLTDNGIVSADVDKSSYVNIKDATAIQYYIAGFEEQSYFCGQYTEGTVTDPTQPTEQPTTQAIQPTTQPTTQSSDNYIYYKNTNNWSTVKAYYWSDSNTSMTSWPGVAMESIGDQIYRVEVPSDADYIIFNNDSGSQTADLTIPGMNKIYNNGVWSNYGGSDVEDETTAPSSDTFVYYKNTNNWSTVKAYYWSDSNTSMTSWPGVAMESIGDSIYRIELPSNAQYIIFNDGNGNQTNDIVLQGFNKIYNNGNWSDYSD